MNDVNNHVRTQQDVHNTATTTPTVPFKRKHFHLRDPTPPPAQPPAVSTPTPTASASHEPTQTTQANPEDPSYLSEPISCICGFTLDDGWSIGCDGCPRWCHGICMGFHEKDKENLPERWWCWACKPRPLDAERAKRIQMARLGLGTGGGALQGPGQVQILGWENGHGEQNANGRGNRRSPGVERRTRKPSGTEAFDGKRRRRMSSAVGPVGQGMSPTVSTPSLQPNGEDEHITVDDDAAQNTYVDITSEPPRPQPIDPRDHLRQQAHSWRGVTAIGPSKPPYSHLQPIHMAHPYPPPTQHPIALHPLPANHSQAAQFVPPSYSVHATRPIPSSAFITTYPALITPTSEYLKDPLNAYALLGMPKPYVHLVGDVALDARWCGGKARAEGGKGKGKEQQVEGDGDVDMDSAGERQGDDEGPGNEAETGNEILSFALFALNDLRANEEVVLGWEWDDGNVVHQLPALIGSEGVRTDGNRPPNLNVPHIKAQMSNILHALQSTFTTCACGQSSKTCVLRRMQELVQGSSGSLPSDATPAGAPHPPTPSLGNGYFPLFHQQLPPHTPFSPHPGTPFPLPLTPGLPFPPATPFLPPTPQVEGIPSTPMSSLPPHLQHTSAKVSAPASAPVASSSTLSLSTFPAAKDDLSHRSSDAPLHTDAEKDKPPAEIWGPKTNLPTRQKHPTLNLSLPVHSDLNLGPLIGAKRGIRARERVAGAGGLEGCEMWPLEDDFDDIRNRGRRTPSPPPQAARGDLPGLVVDPGSPSPTRPKRDLRGLGLDTLDGGYWDRKGKGKAKAKAVEEKEAVEVDKGDVGGTYQPRTRRRTRSQQIQPETHADGDAIMEPVADTAEPPERSPSPPPLVEDQMPPKMRKRRIQQEAKAFTTKDRAEVAKVVEPEGDLMLVDEVSSPAQNEDIRQPLERTQSQIEMPPPPVPSIIPEPSSSSPVASPPSTSTSVPPSPSSSFAQLSIVPPTPAIPSPTSTPEPEQIEEVVVTEKPSSPPALTLPTPPVSSESQPSSAEMPAGSETPEPVPSRGSSLTVDAAEETPTDGATLSPQPQRWSPLHQWEPMTRVTPKEDLTKEVKQEMLDGEDVVGGDDNVEMDVDEGSDRTPVVPSSPLSSPPPDTNDVDDMEIDSLHTASPPAAEQPEVVEPPTAPVSEPSAAADDLTQPEPPVIAVTDSDAPTNGHHSPSPPPRATPSPLPTTPSVISISLSVSPQIHSAALPSSPQPDTPQMSDAPMKKQKLSLKDFAARKKRLREAEEAAKAATEEKANPIPENTSSELQNASSAVDHTMAVVETTPLVSGDATVKPPVIEEKKEVDPEVVAGDVKIHNGDKGVIQALREKDKEEFDDECDPPPLDLRARRNQQSVVAEDVKVHNGDKPVVQDQGKDKDEYSDERDPPPLNILSSRIRFNTMLLPPSFFASASRPGLTNDVPNGVSSPTAVDIDMEISPISPNVAPSVQSEVTNDPIDNSSPALRPSPPVPPIKTISPAPFRASSTPVPTPTSATAATFPHSIKPKTSAPDASATAKSLPNPPPNLIHKLPPKPSVAPPPTSGILTGSDAITSIAHPSVLPGAKKEKEKEAERPATPQSPPRGHHERAGSQSSFSSQAKWDPWDQREPEAARRKRREEEERQRQRELDEIDKARIENDNKWMRRRETRSYTESDATRRRDSDYSDDQWQRRDRRRSSRWDSRSPDRRFSPSPSRGMSPRGRRRSSTSSSRASSSRSRSRSRSRALATPPPQHPPPMKRASVPALFYSPNSRTASPAPLSNHHLPPPTPPSTIFSNPKWSSTNMVAADDPKGGSPFPFFSRQPPAVAQPPTAPPASVPSPALAPPAPPAVPTLAQRSRTPPTQPRSFANTTREPPKGPRALMAQQNRLGGFNSNAGNSGLA
ncbi:SET domain-containing protein 3, partial [Marasmius crinis-equi]